MTKPDIAQKLPYNISSTPSGLMLRSLFLPWVSPTVIEMKLLRSFSAWIGRSLAISEMKFYTAFCSNVAEFERSVR